ncbi:MAG: PocR ligand-binding domain-containing protein [Tissierellia bacterium]|nr:PocR ligand-binding domain-containing protein [Tissierellia bacterium]
MKILSLFDIVDLHVLQEMQDSFSTVTKLAMVIVDYRGKPVTKYSNFTNFCKFMRSNSICRKLCFDSDAYAGIKAARNSEPYIYSCYAGLVDIAIPIVFQGQMLGSILAGQVRTSDEDFPEHILDDREMADRYLNREEAKKLLSETPLVKSQDLRDSVKMIHIFSNYIVEMGISKSAQRELAEKNERLKHEMDVKVSLEKTLRESEIKILRSQINPHFLFNVLNNINNLAMIEEADKTSEMVYTFTDMLRYTMQNDSSNEVTLREELNYVKQYLTIQKMRFGSNLKYVIFADEYLLDIPCPFMIIQPLVANSIDHGLFQSRNQGTVRVSIEDNGEDILITVFDNGEGMDQKIIDEILYGNESSIPSKTGMGIGLINIDKRLMYQYGKDARLQISSELGKYTKVQIHLPKKEVDYENSSRRRRIFGARSY